MIRDLPDELLRRFASAVRGAQLYAPSHPIVTRGLAALFDLLTDALASSPTVAFATIGDEVIVGDAPVPNASPTAVELMRRLRARGIERMTFGRGLTADETASLVSTLNRALAGLSATPRAMEEAFAALPHARVGRVHVDDRTEASVADMATIRRLYGEAIAAATRIWRAAESGEHPDLGEIKAVVNSLAHTVAHNRTAVMALTALKNHDNYTFTHMVNVSILTMAQARGLGIDGSLLRELGLAALLHDLGKVRTPPDILHKADKLTPQEEAIIRRHPIDGAEMLRREPDIPLLAPIVALEHHLRLDGSGYPAGVSRPSLNLGTLMCSIADVYDAMRTERRYQQACPTDRILEVLRRNDGREFDPHLVRRFVQLVGLYPAGSLVRLNTGAIAVVRAVNAADPHKPSVRVVRDPARGGRRVPYDVNLWEHPTDAAQPTAISAPVDPADAGIDPLQYL